MKSKKLTETPYFRSIKQLRWTALTFLGQHWFRLSLLKAWDSVALPVSAAQAAAMKSFGDLSLVVLSGDHHPAPYADWQCDLARLSSRGVQLSVRDCGHWIHLDRPELVTEAIRQVVAAARHNPETKSSPETVKQ